MTGKESYSLTAKAIATLRQVVRDVAQLRSDMTARRGPTPPRYPIAIRAVVVGIDIATWGAGRKKLSCQKLTGYPFAYGGDVITADGWIDSPIVCGQEVLLLAVSRVQGDPTDRPMYVALPMIAVDQSNLDEPDPGCTTRVVSPCLPLLTQPPCQAQ